jgi:lysine-N-methylase
MFAYLLQRVGIWIDSSKAERYLSLEGEFGDELRANIVKGDDDKYYFKLKENFCCPFLDENQLCRVYQNLEGHDALCFTCQIYPRGQVTVGDLVLSYLGMSCPEAGRLLLQKEEPLEFGFSENDIHPDEELDWEKFNVALKSMIAIIYILQNRNLSMSKRLTAIYLFQSHLQATTSSGENPKELLEIFSDYEQWSLVVSGMLEVESHLQEKVDYIALIANSLDGYYISPSLNKMLALYRANREEIYRRLSEESLSFDLKLTKEEEREYEHFLVYLFFRHYMKEAVKEDYMKCTLNILASFLVFVGMKTCGEIISGEKNDLEKNCILIADVSRCIEHYKDGMNIFYTVLTEGNMSDLSSMMKLWS